MTAAAYNSVIIKDIQVLAAGSESGPPCHLNIQAIRTIELLAQSPCGVSPSP
ncbi:hypothetical protein MPOCJGCO_2814 [Methylobacterium trifolii]|uniref:Uncharacterized protein n=1 Tax=Methylobacterium trifolii TaxID=1003092 RepID=A0ABQ4TZM0_9HYPH|nr:hypothetical protein MPOCJGCO_2814 [Methylobacterium trifolii]